MSDPVGETISVSAFTQPRRRVGPLRAALLTYRVVVRQIATTGRFVGLGLLGVAMIVVGWSLGVVSGNDEAIDDVQLLEEAIGYMDILGLTIIVPMVSLVFASAALGDAQEDGTLVYLWLRPMGRASVVAGAALAAIVTALPLTALPVTLGGWLAGHPAGESAGIIWGALAASMLGTVAYVCLFVLAGLLFKRSTLWGIAYILLWEGLAVNLGSLAARLSLHGYTRSVLSHVAEVDSGLAENFADYSLGASVAVLALMAGVSMLLAAVRLDRMSVA